MSNIAAERRGGLVALAVAVAIGVLLVVLQPGPKRSRASSEDTVVATSSSTSTLSPAAQVCNLAKRFVHDSAGLEPHDVARIAEVFYLDAVKLVDGSARAEFDATARYYVEFNAIGAENDYDVYRIAAAGKGDRWAQLLYRPPLGIESARSVVQFACQVELPPPPTLTTLAPKNDDDELAQITGRTTTIAGTPAVTTSTPPR